MDLLKNILKFFIKDVTSLLCLSIITIFFLIAIFAYQIMPDKTPMANNIQLAIAKKKPGFSCDYILVQEKKNTNKNKNTLNLDSDYNEIFIRDSKIINDTLYYVPISKSGFDFEKISINDIFCSNDNEIINSRKFILGTDRYGRDLLSRIILGTRISFSVGFISVFMSLIIGILLGLIAGYYGGATDLVISWLINVVWSIPTLLLVIAISVVLGKGFWQVFVAVGLTMWVEVARVTRGEVLKIVQMPYIEAVKSLGLGDLRIMIMHILPNILNPLIVISAANFSTSILLESGLSFLGVGVQPPTPSWGMIIKNHYGFIIVEKAYLTLYPGICIIVLVLSFMLLSNRLRDLFEND